jgi:hypothetical protein
MTDAEYVGTYRIECGDCGGRTTAAARYCPWCGGEFDR